MQHKIRRYEEWNMQNNPEECWARFWACMRVILIGKLCNAAAGFVPSYHCRHLHPASHNSVWRTILFCYRVSHGAALPLSCVASLSQYSRSRKKHRSALATTRNTARAMCVWKCFQLFFAIPSCPVASVAFSFFTIEDTENFHSPLRRVFAAVCRSALCVEEPERRRRQAEFFLNNKFFGGQVNEKTIHELVNTVEPGAVKM